MVLWLLGAIQIVLGARVVLRLIYSAGGVRVRTTHDSRCEQVSVIVPVLNETTRIRPCLDSLLNQPEAVAEILVVDGGSIDGTQSIVESYSSHDRRIRLIDAGPVPWDWAGKAWGLSVGLEKSDPRSKWILCIDADVRVSPQLVPSLSAHAERTGISIFSVATRQHLSTLGDALLHPSLLTTLVYRFGIPGKATPDRHLVQANGQCFISPRDILLKTDALRAAKQSLCEDFTIARRLAECGETIGFYECDGLVEVQMYQGYCDTWRNWPRSLPTRDQYFGWRQSIGLLEVLFVQSLPLPLLAFASAMDAPYWIVAINLALSLLRLGSLKGVARAYDQTPWLYWLSPLLDLPVAARLVASAFSRRQTWRGRVYRRRSGGTFEPLDKSKAAVA